MTADATSITEYFPARKLKLTCCSNPISSVEITTAFKPFSLRVNRQHQGRPRLHSVERGGHPIAAGCADQLDRRTPRIHHQGIPPRGRGFAREIRQPTLERRAGHRSARNAADGTQITGRAIEDQPQSRAAQGGCSVSPGNAPPQDKTTANVLTNLVDVTLTTFSG